VLIEKYRKKTSLVEWNDELSFKDMDVRGNYKTLRPSISTQSAVRPSFGNTFHG
jgi:hypothetical protein